MSPFWGGHGLFPSLPLRPPAPLDKTKAWEKQQFQKMVNNSHIENVSKSPLVPHRHHQTFRNSPSLLWGFPGGKRPGALRKWVPFHYLWYVMFHHGIIAPKIDPGFRIRHLTLVANLFVSRLSHGTSEFLHLWKRNPCNSVIQEMNEDDSFEGKKFMHVELLRCPTAGKCTTHASFSILLKGTLCGPVRELGEMNAP